MGGGPGGLRVHPRRGGDARRARRARAGALVPRRRERGRRRPRARRRGIRADRPLRRGGPRWRSGSRTSTSSPGGRRPRAAGSRAPSAPSTAPALCAGQGWVAVERARHAETVEECAAHARAGAGDRAADGRRTTSRCSPLSLLGRAEVSAGRIDEGMRLLEEAMAAASAGRVRNVHTLAEAYCNLIVACTSAGDWERATEWCELVDEFAREHETAPLLRVVPHDPRRRPPRNGSLGRRRARPAERARRARPLRPPAGRRRRSPRMAELRVRQGRLLGGRAAARRARGASGVAPRARPPAPRPGPAAASRPRCSSAGSLAAEATPVRDRAAARAARRRAPRRGRDRRGRGRRAARRSSRTSRASALVAARAELAAARAHVAAERPDAAAEAARGALADVRSTDDAVRDGGGPTRARAGARAGEPGPRRRGGARGLRELPRARRVAGAGRGGGTPARLGAPTGGLPRASASSPRASARCSACSALGMSNAQIAETLVHQREDGRSPRQPHPRQARRPQPRRGGGRRRAERKHRDVEIGSR